MQTSDLSLATVSARIGRAEAERDAAIERADELVERLDRVVSGLYAACAVALGEK